MNVSPNRRQQLRSETNRANQFLDKTKRELAGPDSLRACV